MSSKQKPAAGGAGLPALGVDLVHVPTFEQQLHVPGTRFGQRFSPFENRRAQQLRHSHGPRRSAEFLAGCWAAREALIKAWDGCFVGMAPPLEPDAAQLTGIATARDAWGRPLYELAPPVRELMERSVGAHRLSLSISHDGEYALAACQISGV